MYNCWFPLLLCVHCIVCSLYACGMFLLCSLCAYCVPTVNLLHNGNKLHFIQFSKLWLIYAPAQALRNESGVISSSERSDTVLPLFMPPVTSLLQSEARFANRYHGACSLKL
jgi:hypothetical protein